MGQPELLELISNSPLLDTMVRIIEHWYSQPANVAYWKRKDYVKCTAVYFHGKHPIFLSICKIYNFCFFLYPGNLENIANLPDHSLEKAYRPILLVKFYSKKEYQGLLIPRERPASLLVQ